MKILLRSTGTPMTISFFAQEYLFSRNFKIESQKIFSNCSVIFSAFLFLALVLIFHPQLCDIVPFPIFLRKMKSFFYSFLLVYFFIYFVYKSVYSVCFISLFSDLFFCPKYFKSRYFFNKIPEKRQCSSASVRKCAIQDRNFIL